MKTKDIEALVNAVVRTLIRHNVTIHRNVAVRQGTLKHKIHRLLENSRPLHLQEIYSHLDANSIGERAAIRGEVNKSHQTKGIFKRHSRATYCMR